MYSRFLSHEEISYWADKFKLNSPVNYFYGNPQSITQDFFDSQNIKRSIDYRFVFSISKNNIQRFENLLSQFLKDGFKQGIMDGGKYYYENIDDKDLLQLKSIEIREEHQTYGVDFIKFTYNFRRCPLLQTMLFIQTIKDVIKIIGDFWGFDENGNEICSIKHPVGSIVSLTTDKSDFFVESITFVRENTDGFKQLKLKYGFKEELLLYNLLKIESNTNSQVLEFSEIWVRSSDDIIPNRGQRIDEILDN